jgi:16S rRNA (cytidine1402-2'-O)-methyltransferase
LSRHPPPPQLSDVPLEAGLYIVATPIGNLRDITLRALDVLSGCDLLLAEDTRVTGKLLAAYGLSKTMARYDEHATERARPRIMPWKGRVVYRALVEKVRGGFVEEEP